MKTIYSRLLLLAVLVFSGSSILNAQCTGNTTSGSFCTRSSFFDAQYNADLGCGSYRTITNYSPGEYFRMPILSGGCYTVQTCGAAFDTQIGVFQGTTTTNPFAYNDDNGPICTGTRASVNFVPTFTDYVRVDVRQYNCQPGGASSITVRIRQNNNLNITSSSASMCAGQTRALTATPTSVTGNLTGSGNSGSFSGIGVSGTTFTAPTPAGASQNYTITYTFGYCTTTQVITVFRNPTAANAGPNQSISCSATTATLSGNSPTFGSGVWTLVSGTGSITSPTNPSSGVTGLTPGGTSVFRWTISNNPCSASSDNVTISSNTDGTAPVPNVFSLPNITAQCTVTSFSPPTATDNCAGTITGTTGTSLPITTQGTTTVTWTYNDGSGNISTQTQNVIINDGTSPVPSVSSLPNVTAQCTVTSLSAPSATDNCGGSVTVTNNASLPITSQGTTVVTWTYTDVNGNSSTQTQNVIINDVTAPVPSAGSLPNVTAACVVTSLTAPTATDNCGGSVTVTNNASLPITTQGTTVVTWTYNDGNGNTSTQTQNVILNDVTPPVASSATLADINATCSVTSLVAPTATDNCGGVITGTSSVSLPITTQGTTTITWTYTDANGNSSTQTQNIIITDGTPPVPNIASLPNVTAQCEVTSLTAPTATDNCGGTVIVTNNASLPITTQGTTAVTWTYDDGNGNTTTQVQLVVIDDVSGPVADVATLADVTAACQVTSLTAPTATDNCGGIVTVSNNASLPITSQGTTTITWTYTDVNGNSSSQTQDIVISDVIAPVADIATLANVTATCEVTSLTAPSATDNCGGVVTVTSNASLPITTQGTTVITWTYTDVNGNSSTQTQNVVITDATSPVASSATLADINATCEVTSLIPPTATDNCGGVVTVTNNVTLPITAQGTTVITWTYTDGAGNTSIQTQNVVITDGTSPVPDLATLADVTAECSVTSLTPPTATDNCGGIVTVTNNVTLPITTQGTTVVTWTYDDGNGNTATQSQIVIIDDVSAPVADLATLADVTAECTVTSLTAPTATDNCGGLVTVSNNASLPISTQGTTVITWTYTDPNGNSSTQTQNVVITDVTAPVPNTATLPDVVALCEVTTLTAPTGTDNCGGIVTVTNNASLPISAQGTTVVTWTFTDVNGNSSTQPQNVVITDVIAPVANVVTLADVTAQCTVTSLTAPTATDNCAGLITGTSNASLPITAQGTTVVTWTYTDAAGNSSTQTQDVVITDVTSPVADLASLPDVTAECEVTSLTAPTASDNCGGIVAVTNNAALPITNQGTTVVTWTYDDGNGNTSTQVQLVIIDDVTGPLADVAILSDVTAECEVTSLTAPTATDNCGGLVTVSNNASLPITAQGTTVVTWTYMDGEGNTSTQTQNVVITDVTAPVADAATLPDVVDGCAITSLTAPSATDNCGGIVTVTNDATLPILLQGTTVITWTYTDVNGNSSTQTQNAVITDAIPPVADIPVLADINAACEVTSLTSPSASDNCGGIVVATSNASLPITTQGTTVITWTYTDDAGNTSTQTQNVIITDISGPVADVAVLADVTDECSVASLTAPTATDNCGGIVTVTNNATLPITAQGTTIVAWTYTDVNGNSTLQNQNVVITDVTAPVADVVTLADLTAACEITSLTAPTATDNCGGIVAVTNNATLPITAQGTTVITWTYTDANGNSSTQVQNVILTDVTAPVADVATLADVTSECEITTLTAPTATDNCGGIVTVTNNASLPITAQGTTVVTWTYDDGNGNTSTQTQNVVITDVTAPVANVATLADVTAQCEVTSLTAPTATDNCGGIVTITNNATLPISAQGTTVVTWTYTDVNGNSSTQLQAVIIDDVTAPIGDVATLADVTAACEVTSLTAPTATDNCGGTVTVTNDATLPILAQGTTVVTWTYDDGNGNTSTQTQNIVITDVTAPVADLATLADVTDECSIATLTAPTATDNCGGVVTVTNDATLPIVTQGTTVVTWTYTDVNGNSSTQTQNIVITDVTSPVADAATLADVNDQCEVTSLTAPTATDNCGGIVTVTNDATLPISTQGTTIVTWTYTDVNGNSSTQTQNVVITDVTAPVADAATLADVTDQCEVTSLTAPTATDNCAGVVTVTNNVTLPISIQGTTVVTWTYDDGNGNTSTQTQLVIIDDVTAPIADVATLADVTADCEVTSLTAPTATDNCGGIVTVTNDVTLPISIQGTTVVTWTYTDVNGNTSTQTQNIVITDVTPPVADAATLTDVTDECSVATLTAPTATDNCGGIVTVTNDAILPVSTQGTTVVTWTYTDVNGNTSTQTQNIVITDITSPVADLATLADITDECSVTSLTAPTATDNCGGIVTVTNDATLPIAAQGTTVVTWTYDDGNGNTTTQTQNVIITDVTAPVADVVTLADVTAQCEVTTLTDPTATDNCGGVVTVTNDATLPITAQGTTVVTWTYTDVNGNVSTQVQAVVITDVTAPVPDLATLTDVTDECSIATLAAPTATDNCGGTVTVTNDAALPITTQGTTVVTWTYDDGNGNTTTQTQNVVITDVTAPVADIATLADVTAECEIVSLIDPTATDNCGGLVTVTNDATLPISAQGTTVVTWTYTDVNGNSSTQTQNVVITDVTGPVADVTTLVDVTDECSVTTLTAPTATDNCGGVVTVTNDATLPISTQGTTVVTWTYTDVNGNSTTQTQNVVIIDVTAPVADVATLTDVTATCEVTSLIDPTATDNCGGVVTVTNDAILPITAQGTTVVTWTYTDVNGNASTQTQNVVITDVTAPVADLATLSDVTDECSVATLVAPTATDNCGGVVTVTNDAMLPITTQGTTIVTWTYTDVNGNSSTQTQNVVITDVTAPVADLATLADITDECSVATLVAPTATDNCGGIVTVTNDATLPISTQGTTIVTWTYTDVNGNASTQTQNVVITDVTAPVADIPTLADVTAQCEVTTLTDPTATDNCGGIVTVTNDATLPISTQGTTVVTWTYTDVNGNASTQTQNVVITDITAPVADLATLADVTDECSVATLVAPTGTDNCGGIVTVTNDAVLPITAQGTTVVTWTYDDGNGNTSAQVQLVIIDDVTAPVADIATLADVTAECEVTTLTDPTATDNCGGIVTVTNDAVLPMATQGTTVITWTYTDVNGNASTQTQNVVITDVTAPVADLATLVDLTAQCEITTLADPTATDNCGGLVTVTNDATLPIGSQGTTVITWTYTDVNGNASTQTQNVVITDATAPVADAAILADVTAECEVTGLNAPTATDNCVGTIIGTTTDPTVYTMQGTYVVTWTFDDGNGNSITQTQNIVIQDVSAPLVVTPLPTVTDECSVTLAAPTVNDACVGPVTGTTVTTFPITTQGTTIVEWFYDDGLGNVSSQTQMVTINDVTAPIADVATLTDVTAQCEVTTLTAPTATDNCGGSVTVTNDAILPISAQGTTTVTWTYTDGVGNSSTQTQNVVITDVVGPVADLATLPDVIEECTAVLVPPTATDACGGIVVTGTTTDPLSYSTQGTYSVTWTYTDGAGNTTTQMQNVFVNDVNGPVPNTPILADISATCITTPLVPSATDNCAGQINGTTTTTFPITASTTITWTYADGNGNTTTQTQDVIITGVDVSTTLLTGGVEIMANNANGSSYQWIDCNNGNVPVGSGTNQSYTATVDGSYAVIINENGCVDTSACVVINSTKVDDLSLIDFVIYPNPAVNGSFTIEIDEQIAQVQLIDMQGRIVDVIYSAQTGQVDISNLEMGNYFVKINTENGHVLVKPIVIAN